MPSSSHAALEDPLTLRSGLVLPARRIRGPLELAGESEWYEAQLARISRGLAPDPDLDHLRTPLAFIAGEAWRGLTSGRRRRRIARDTDSRMPTAA